MNWTDLFTDPKIISSLGLSGVLIVGLLFGLYKLFKRYDDIQEKRIKDALDMQKEYMELTNNVNKTLDILITMISSKRNGGNNGA